MTKNYTRMFRKCIIMLCVCAYIDAALNYVDHDANVTREVAQQPIIPQQAPALTTKQSLATQVDISRVETQSSTTNNTASPARTHRVAAPESALENNDDETVEFYFEDADIDNLLKQISSLYDVVFITDDMVTMADGKLPEGKKALKGNKLSFKTNKPLTKRAAWDLFLTFLDMAGFTLTTESKPNIYRVVQIPNGASIKAPIPAYIGVDPSKLPTNDQMIRYVYFAQNTSAKALFAIVDPLRSSASGSPILLEDMQAIMITDKAYNIVSLMEIVKELDRVAMPQAMSVLKLKRADAKDVKALYEQITGTGKDENVASRLFPRKQPTNTYFPETVRIIPYDRANALILLGNEDSIRKIEEFVTKHVDIDVTAPYPPIRVHNLRYADAKQIADIMNGVTNYSQDSEAGKSGGVRGEDKYLKKMNFTAEPASNRLIIEGDEEDYLMAKEVLDKLDERQPQIAIEALLLSISINDNKQLGSQLRSKVPGVDGLLGNTAKFQTSGLFGTAGIQLAPSTTPGAQTGANRLLANLVNLAIGAPVGNTVVSLGSDAYGVWGLLQALQTISNTQIIATPFLVATNKTKARVVVGQTRRVIVANVIASSNNVASNDDKAANLILEVTPQINSDGMIILDLAIRVDQFADALNFTSATVNTKTLNTTTIVSNGEVLALGGLIQNSAQLNMSQTPILGKIPILGWLFKNRQDSQQRNNLLVLMCARILPPESEYEADRFTQNRILAYHTSLAEMINPTISSDPINKFFFEAKNDSTERVMENFMFNRQGNTKEETPDPNIMLLKPQLDNPKKNQRARKRSSRNRFASSGENDVANNNPVVNKKAAPEVTTEIAALNPPTQEATAIDTAQNVQATKPSAPKKSLKRSAQRTRPSLSTFMNDTSMDEAIS
jgi:general secretion pathway protein D